MNEYNITVRGQLQRFIGIADTWFVGETEVFFKTRDQALDTPLHTDLAISVNSNSQVYPGEGYYVLT